MPNATRRNVLKMAFVMVPPIGFSSVLIGGSKSALAQPRRAAPARAARIERWMDEWMDAPRAPGGTLHLSRFKDPVYFLTTPIGWKPNDGIQTAPPEAVEVPVGFVTDFASIPRVFWSLLRPDGIYTYPAIIHDYLYWSQTRPRKVADAVFRLSMEDFKVDRATSFVIYRAVRAAGWSAWSSNAKLKAQGESRILKVFPTDPTTTWAQWKGRPEVFDPQPSP
jgi:hypothetical protein